ncbi:hypothetical protein Rt10032_c08g3566 [Rhodotorula toruloides]|uniref:Uncharacterized protein n=1 Tax=Rhodotorula toruloides TaxID=5286 RepID=A0A511KGQ3_RHOTO|nr:hypothetical protein Rt10032_c08g3566 [Rhodotorula toruloides]
MSVVLPYAFHPPSNPSSSPIMSGSSIAGSAAGASSGSSSAVGSVPNLPSGSLGSTLEALRTLVGKRITAWTYLKNAGEGRVYWFNTVLLTSDDLKSSFPNQRMRNRTTRFAVLGMSLSSLLDISPAHDFLRGLLSLVQDFDAMPEERFGGRGQQQKSLFKVGSRSRRGGGMPGGGGGGGADFSMGLPQEGAEGSYLYMPNIPFDLDYFQVLITLCELLVETYSKIFSYLGPAALSGSSAAAGLFPQPPGVRGSVLGSVGGGPAGMGLSQALTDVVYKIDARLKKIVSLLSQEFDGIARAAIKTELNSLLG